MDFCDSLDLSNTRLLIPLRVLLSAFGINVQSRIVLNWFIILGPNELRVWRHLITFKVQGNYSIVIYINHHFLGSLKSKNKAISVSQRSQQTIFYGYHSERGLSRSLPFSQLEHKLLHSLVFDSQEQFFF